LTGCRFWFVFPYREWFACQRLGLIRQFSLVGFPTWTPSFLLRGPLGRFQGESLGLSNKEKWILKKSRIFFNATGAFEISPLVKDLACARGDPRFYWAE
jgi:hypothetical protein